MTHSRKILSQAGTALADIYDVEGSVVGLENLDVSEIKGVHDLGPTIHSERLITFHLVATAPTVAQSTAWDVTLGSFPDSINRLLSVFVLADTAARVALASVAILDTGAGIDHPVWVWDSVGDVESSIRWRFGAVATEFALRSAVPYPAGAAPNLLTRTGASRAMPELVFRGQTSAFGAGTVTIRALISVARPDRGAPGAGEPSSHGLPIPGW